MVIIQFATSDYDGQRFGSVYDIQSYDNPILTSEKYGVLPIKPAVLIPPSVFQRHKMNDADN